MERHVPHRYIRKPKFDRLAIGPGEAHHKVTEVGGSGRYVGPDGVDIAVRHAFFGGLPGRAALGEGEALLAFVEAEAKHLGPGDEPVDQADGRECADEHER